MTSDRGFIEPDSKDWTWVLSQPCRECGFDAATVRPADVPGRIRRDADEWVSRLNAEAVTARPAPNVWSVLEYGCHVRDVHRIFAQRVRLMLAQDEPRFPNWDQDRTAVDDNYAAQDPVTVAAELSEAANAVAAIYDSVPAESLGRRGLRSNGSEFTIGSIALYHLHDVVHHAHDVSR
jgi:hypothetical protein